MELDAAIAHGMECGLTRTTARCVVRGGVHVYALACSLGVGAYVYALACA